MNETQAVAYDKQSLLAIFKPRVVEKFVKDVGTIRLRELSAPEVSEIRKACQAEDKKGDFGIKLVIASVVDQGDKPVFSDADLPELRPAAQSRLGNLVTAVMEVNGFHIDAKAVEDAAKN